MSSSSIWPIDRILSDAPTTDQNWADDNWPLYNSQNSSITESSLTDYLVSYSGHMKRKSYPFAEMQSGYSTVPVDWAFVRLFIIQNFKFKFEIGSFKLAVNISFHLGKLFYYC